MQDAPWIRLENKDDKRRRLEGKGHVPESAADAVMLPLLVPRRHDHFHGMRCVSLSPTA